MAELVLFITDDVRPDTKYQDGDILCAFTGRRIAQVSIQALANPVAEGFDANGLRKDALARMVAERTHKYRFVRTSKTEVHRYTIATETYVPITDTPTLIEGKMQHMYVEQFVRRRLAHPRHRMFGTPGAEIWYGGKQDWSEANTDVLWDLVEGETAHRKADHTKWPMTERELHKFLVLPTEPMSEGVANRAVASEIDFDKMQPEFSPAIDENDESIGNNMVTLRRSFIEWRDLAGFDNADAMNQGKRMDLRDIVAPLTAAAARAKPRKNIWSEREHLTDGEFIG